MIKRIYYHDTDAGGVVYYGNYLKYLEEARTEFLEKRDLSVNKMIAQGCHYAVRKCNIQYKSPARYGDTIVCGAELIKMTAAQMIFNQIITHQEDGRVLVSAEVSLVCLDNDFKPITIPESVKTLLSK